MIVHISDEAEADLADGFWFYDVKEPGLGSEFRDSLKFDIRSLERTGGSHNIRHGYHRKLCKRFPCSSSTAWTLNHLSLWLPFSGSGEAKNGSLNV